MWQGNGMKKTKTEGKGGVKKGERQATLGTIAAAAGVSRATVSRALNDNPVISQKVRLKIQGMAKKLGYRPDPEVSRLLGYLKRSRKAAFVSVIGVLDAFRPPLTMKADAYTVRLLAGAKERAEALGYRLEELALYAERMTPRRFDQIVQARGIKGLLVPPEPEPLFQAGIDWGAVMAVATTTTARPLDLHRVLPHNHTNMRRLIEAGLEWGYKRPGLVSWPILDERQMNAPSAIYAWYAHGVKRIPALPVFEWNWREPAKMERGMATWMKRYEPDMVLGPAGVVREVIEAATGRRAPKDYGFASYGEDRAGMTRVDQLPEAVGSAAVDMLSAHIQRGETGMPVTPKTTLIEGRVIREGSC